MTIGKYGAWALLLCAATIAPLSAQNETPPMNVTPPPPADGKAILPRGPYAGWPEEQREDALDGLRKRCAVLGVMVFDNYRGPVEAAAQDTAAFAAACVAAQMPDDWPGKTAEQANARTAYDAARKIDPKVPDPDDFKDALRRN